MRDKRVRCFWLEDTGKDRLYLRRYKSSSSDYKCPGRMSYHNAMMFVEDRVSVRDERGYILSINASEFKDDPRWLTRCGCGYEFLPEDHWQVFTESIYRRVDTGEEMILPDAPAGAMWDAWWMPDCWKGHDGKCLMVKLPNGRDWMVDGQASNCTLPEDKEHKCWTRAGEPPNVDVGKGQYGPTCAAGAGSIQAGDYHGFLRHGWLEEC